MKNNRKEGNWEQRIRDIDWSQFQTAYGVATTVPKQLIQLRSEDEQATLSAAHDLWCGLCHQHVQVGSAALPALPFLMEVLIAAGDQLKIEILDILLGFAITTDPIRLEHWAKNSGHDVDRPAWIAELRSALIEQLQVIAPLQAHSNSEVADFARAIIGDLRGENSQSVQPGVASDSALPISRPPPPNSVD